MRKYYIPSILIATLILGTARAEEAPHVVKVEKHENTSQKAAKAQRRKNIALAVCAVAAAVAVACIVAHNDGHHGHNN